MTDIRVGDLVKATKKGDPEVTTTGRVTYLSEEWVENSSWSLRTDAYDFEVLDRPIDEELLKGAVLAFKRAANEPEGGGLGYPVDPAVRPGEWGHRLTAVINYVNEYHNKKEKQA